MNITVILTPELRLEQAVNPEDPVFASENGVLFSKDKSELLFFTRERQGDYLIPDTVKTIRSDAFSHSNLTIATIPMLKLMPMSFLNVIN